MSVESREKYRFGVMRGNLQFLKIVVRGTAIHIYQGGGGGVRVGFLMEKNKKKPDSPVPEGRFLFQSSPDKTAVTQTEQPGSFYFFQGLVSTNTTRSTCACDTYLPRGTSERVRLL